MRELITFKRKYKELAVYSFEGDKLIQINIESSGTEIAYFYLSPNEVNDLITFLANQLKSINEPVEILTKQLNQNKI